MFPVWGYNCNFSFHICNWSFWLSSSTILSSWQQLIQSSTTMNGGTGLAAVTKKLSQTRICTTVESATHMSWMLLKSTYWIWYILAIQLDLDIEAYVSNYKMSQTIKSSTHRFFLKLRIIDETDSINVILFDQVARVLIGRSCEDVYDSWIQVGWKYTNFIIYVPWEYHSVYTFQYDLAKVGR